MKELALAKGKKRQRMLASQLNRIRKGEQNEMDAKVAMARKEMDARVARRVQLFYEDLAFVMNELGVRYARPTARLDTTVEQDSFFAASVAK